MSSNENRVERKEKGVVEELKRRPNCMGEETEWEKWRNVKEGDDTRKKMSEILQPQVPFSI